MILASACFSARFQHCSNHLLFVGGNHFNGLRSQMWFLATAGRPRRPFKGPLPLVPSRGLRATSLDASGQPPHARCGGRTRAARCWCLTRRGLWRSRNRSLGAVGIFRLPSWWLGAESMVWFLFGRGSHFYPLQEAENRSNPKPPIQTNKQREAEPVLPLGRKGSDPEAIVGAFLFGMLVTKLVRYALLRY